MTRQEVARIFEGATDEQINQILNIHSADIGKAKGDATKLQADLDAANAALKTAQETINGLEANKADADALQKQLDSYKAAEEQRKKDAAAAAERETLSKRMETALNGRKLVHDRLHDVLMDDFKAALADAANVGKSDNEIFDALTKDKNYFANMNPSAGNTGGFDGDIDAAQIAAVRAAMGLPAEK